MNTYSTEGEATEAEPRMVELLSDSCCQTFKQSNVECEEITMENGDVMEEHVGITSTEYHERNDDHG